MSRTETSGVADLSRGATEVPEGFSFSDRIQHQVSLSQAIYQALRDSILSRQLEPGTLLRQEELARAFNASRVPLREALNYLEAEGLVVLRPRRGYAVASLDASEFLELFQLRMVLEEHAGYVATLGRTSSDVTNLEACLQETERLARRTDRTDRSAWFTANERFHDTLVGVSGRAYLQQLSRRTRAKLDPYVRMEVEITKNLEKAQGDHRAMFEAFKAGDADLVARLSRSHCESTAARFIQALHGKGLAQDVSLEAIGDVRPKFASKYGSAKRRKLATHIARNSR